MGSPELLLHGSGGTAARSDDETAEAQIVVSGSAEVLIQFFCRVLRRWCAPTITELLP